MGQPSKQAVTEEIWGLLAAMMVARRDAGFELAESYGLSIGDMKALLSFNDEPPPTMSSLAGTWDCDASNVTWLVDRLEQGGWVERQASSRDRRVKTVALTPSGRKVRDEIRAAFSEAPDVLQRLSLDDLVTVAELLRGIGLEPRPFSDMVRTPNHRPRPTGLC